METHIERLQYKSLYLINFTRHQFAEKTNISSLLRSEAAANGVKLSKQRLSEQIDSCYAQRLEEAESWIGTPMENIKFIDLDGMVLRASENEEVNKKR